MSSFVKYYFIMRGRNLVNIFLASWVMSRVYPPPKITDNTEKILPFFDKYPIVGVKEKIIKI